MNVVTWSLIINPFTKETFSMFHVQCSMFNLAGGNLNFSPGKTARISSWAKTTTQAGFTLVGSVLGKRNRGPGEAKEDVWDILEAEALSFGVDCVLHFEDIEQQ